MRSLMEHMAWCEERSGRPRPGDSVAREHCITLGLIECVKPHSSATNQRPYWRRTEAGRAWTP